MYSQRRYVSTNRPRDTRTDGGYYRGPVRYYDHGNIHDDSDDSMYTSSQQLPGPTLYCNSINVIERIGDLSHYRSGADQTLQSKPIKKAKFRSATWRKRK